MHKITLFHGDITTLQVDAIVNAAKNSLLGGGGVDGRIHKVAGPGLLRECRTLDGCETGQAKITNGYNLPAKHVIHTVGPRGEKPLKLREAYWNSLETAKQHSLKSIAFPCISTGIYAYPIEPATHVALKTVSDWLNTTNYDIAVTFCVYLDKDLDVYKKLLPMYFT
jgi:O-acetyl-ADP-ribose deacetylase (regulator of RNase III)